MKRREEKRLTELRNGILLFSSIDQKWNWVIFHDIVSQYTGVPRPSGWKTLVSRTKLQVDMHRVAVCRDFFFLKKPPQKTEAAEGSGEQELQWVKWNLRPGGMTGNETQREASWVEGLTLQEQSGHWLRVRLPSLHWASLLDELQMIVIMGVKAAAVRPPHEAGAPSGTWYAVEPQNGSRCAGWRPATVHLYNESRFLPC